MFTRTQSDFVPKVPDLTAGLVSRINRSVPARLRTATKSCWQPRLRRSTRPPNWLNAVYQEVLSPF